MIEPIDIRKPEELGRTYYLPHHEVIRTDKHTTKLSAVYDASARAERSQPSLNDCFYSGPPITPLVLDVLLRFRAYPVALTASKISIDPGHCDYLRLLWIDDIAAEEPRAVVFRFTRVVFGVSPSPFLLNGTIHYHLSNRAVDDELARKEASTCGNASQVHQLYRRGLIKLRATWSRLQRTQLAASIQLTIPSESGQESNVNHKVLGIGWNVEDDDLVFLFDSLRDTTKIEPVTKRVVLNLSAKQYDPLGLLSPIVLLLKIIFQCLCKSKADWDPPLDDELKKRWIRLVTDVERVNLISLDRHYFKGSSSAEIRDIQLHGFCDASEKAYGAVVYLRARTGSANVITQIVSSKTRVAPIAGETFPRLELTEAVVLARLVDSVSAALSGVLGTDSQIALWWIWGTTKEFKQYVENRVIVICRLVRPECWNYCPSQLNPADIASRGSLASDLISNVLWWKGPEFLQQEDVNRPGLKLSCSNIY